MLCNVSRSSFSICLCSKECLLFPEMRRCFLDNFTAPPEASLSTPGKCLSAVSVPDWADVMILFTSLDNCHYSCLDKTNNQKIQWNFKCMLKIHNHHSLPCQDKLQCAECLNYLHKFAITFGFFWTVKCMVSITQHRCTYSMSKSTFAILKTGKQSVV